MFFWYQVVSVLLGLYLPVSFLLSGSLCDTMIDNEVQRLGSSFICGFTDTFFFMWLLIIGVIHSYFVYIIWSAKEDIGKNPHPELERYRQALATVKAASPPGEMPLNQKRSIPSADFRYAPMPAPSPKQVMVAPPRAVSVPEPVRATWQPPIPPPQPPPQQLVYVSAPAPRPPTPPVSVAEPVAIPPPTMPAAPPSLVAVGEPVFIRSPSPTPSTLRPVGEPVVIKPPSPTPSIIRPSVNINTSVATQYTSPRLVSSMPAPPPPPTGPITWTSGPARIPAEPVVVASTTRIPAGPVAVTGNTTIPVPQSLVQPVTREFPSEPVAVEPVRFVSAPRANSSVPVISATTTDYDGGTVYLEADAVRTAATAPQMGSVSLGRSTYGSVEASAAMPGQGIFDQIDRDGNGVIDRRELDQATMSWLRHEAQTRGV